MSLTIDGGTSYKNIGKTEVVYDDLNPRWAKSFSVDYYFEVVQELKIEV